MTADEQFGESITRHNVRLQLAVFLGCAVIVASRMPEVLLAPRLWAEERNYFSYVFLHNIIEGLAYIYWESGYCNLISNLSAVISLRVLPLELAPLGMTYLAFFAQLESVPSLVGN